MKFSKAFKKINWKEKAINWSVFLVVSLIGLVVLELVARVVLSEYDNRGKLRFEIDEALFIRGEQNSTFRQSNSSGEYNISIQFNDFGFRDKKHLPDATEKDIIALGDSYTFGWGVKTEKRFANLLQNDSSKVFNVAAPNDFAGYRNMLNTLKSKRIVTNKLILGVCMENDPQIYDNGTLLPPTMNPPDSSFKNKMKNWLKYHSCLYSYLSTQLKSSQSLNDFFYNRGMIDPLKFPDKLDRMEAVSTSSADFLESILKNHKALVVIIPSRLLWSDDPEVAKKENDFHHHFVSHLLEKKMMVIDLKPVFEKNGNPLQYHFPVDGHWNEKGHQLAAEEIKKYLHLLTDD